MSATFDRFLAIDWSGAKGRYRGVALAACRAGRAAPRLLPAPGGGPWTRSAVAAHVAALCDRPGRTLVGIDCAFSLPAAASRVWLNGGGSAFDLWALVDRVTADHPDYLGAPFARHPDYAEAFWCAGPRRAGWIEPRRETELACRRDRLGAPDSAMKQFGPKTVGPGALAGMRLLHALRRARPGRIAVWPFEPPGRASVVMVEIYPRLFWRRAGRTATAKVRDPAALDAALVALGSQPARLAGELSDHDTDALVAAAGMRQVAAEAETWRPPGLSPDVARGEGWIFGVRG